MTRRFPDIYVGLAALTILLLVPLAVKSSFLLHNFILTFFYAALSSAWNILGGYAGQISLGHTAFFGLAAYTSTLLFARLDVTPWLGLPAGTAVALLGAAVMAVPVVRLRGPFFTLATLAFAEVLRLLAIFWRDLTMGSVGVTLPFRPGWLWLSFQGKLPYYYISLVLLAITLVISRRVYHSRLGYYFRAVRADDQAAAVSGVDVNRMKVLALFLSAGLTGVLGVFYAQYVYFVDPDTAFSTQLFSVQPALNTIIGGFGTVWGPVLGSALMTPLGEFMRAYLGEARQGLNFFLYGVTLMAVVLVLPSGIIGLAGRLASTRRAAGGEYR